jgi:hypothetical protein
VPTRTPGRRGADIVRVLAASDASLASGVGAPATVSPYPGESLPATIELTQRIPA